MSALPQKQYRFSYILAQGSGWSRVYTTVKAANMEAAHEKGKEQALKQFPDAHSFLTEHTTP